MIEDSPCPFCASTNLEISGQDDYSNFRWMLCSDCGAQGPSVYRSAAISRDRPLYDTDRHNHLVTVAWNERVD